MRFLKHFVMAPLLVSLLLISLSIGCGGSSDEDGGDELGPEGSISAQSILPFTFDFSNADMLVVPLNPKLVDDGGVEKYTYMHRITKDLQVEPAITLEKSDITNIACNTRIGSVRVSPKGVVYFTIGHDEYNDICYEMSGCRFYKITGPGTVSCVDPSLKGSIKIRFFGPNEEVYYFVFNEQLEGTGKKDSFYVYNENGEGLVRELAEELPRRVKWVNREYGYILNKGALYKFHVDGSQEEVNSNVYVDDVAIMYNGKVFVLGRDADGYDFSSRKLYQILEEGQSVQEIVALDNSSIDISCELIDFWSLYSFGESLYFGSCSSMFAIVPPLGQESLRRVSLGEELSNDSSGSLYLHSWFEQNRFFFATSGAESFRRLNFADQRIIELLEEPMQVRSFGPVSFNQLMVIATKSELDPETGEEIFKDYAGLMTRHSLEPIVFKELTKNIDYWRVAFLKK